MGYEMKYNFAIRLLTGIIRTKMFYFENKICKMAKNNKDTLLKIFKLF